MESKRIAAEDLTALEPVMKQAQNACIAIHVSVDDYLRLFDEEVRGKIRGTALAPGVTHLVCFECRDQWTSDFGHRISMACGPQNTYTLEKVLRTPYARLGDTPSRYLYPVCYTSVAPLRVGGSGSN